MIPLRQSLELRDCWAVQMGSLLMQKKKRTELDTTKKVVGRDQPDQILYLKKDLQTQI